MTLFRTISVLALSASAAHGFAFFTAPRQSNPALAQYAQAQSGIILDLCLDVGSSKDSRMCLQGLLMELSHEDAVDKERPALPGFDGPNPNVSAGAKSIYVKEDAFFVSMAGKQNVPLHQGCWEMVWRENAPAGVIVCGFVLQETVARNDATLKHGSIYMSFPVWTKRGLKQQQDYRTEMERLIQKQEEAMADAFKKYDASNYIIMKALHFRSAALASDKLSFINADSISKIPLDDDVMAVGGDIVVATKGTVWTKDDASAFGNSRRTTTTLLGTATLRN